MIDIHCHLLHNLDDGPRSMTDAIEMLKAAADDGIDAIIATPHFSPEIAASVGVRADELSEYAHVGGIQLLTGHEYTLSDFCAELDKTVFTLADTVFALVDINACAIPQAMEQLAFKAALKGLRLIIAHPEKLFSLHAMPRMLALHQREIFFQINAASLIGRSGSAAQKMSEKMIAAGICDYVASDAHDLQRRPFAMRQAYDRVKKLFGDNAAQLLFNENQQLLLQNLPPESMPFKRKSFFAGWRR